MRGTWIWLLLVTVLTACGGGASPEDEPLAKGAIVASSTLPESVRQSIQSFQTPFETVPSGGRVAQGDALAVGSTVVLAKRADGEVALMGLWSPDGTVLDAASTVLALARLTLGSAAAAGEAAQAFNERVRATPSFPEAVSAATSLLSRGLPLWTDETLLARIDEVVVQLLDSGIELKAAQATPTATAFPFNLYQPLRQSYEVYLVYANRTRADIRSGSPFSWNASVLDASGATLDQFKLAPAKLATLLETGVPYYKSFEFADRDRYLVRIWEKGQARSDNVRSVVRELMFSVVGDLVMDPVSSISIALLNKAMDACTSMPNTDSVEVVRQCIFDLAPTAFLEALKATAETAFQDDYLKSLLKVVKDSNSTLAAKSAKALPLIGVAASAFSYAILFYKVEALLESLGHDKWVQVCVTGDGSLRECETYVGDYVATETATAAHVCAATDGQGQCQVELFCTPGGYVGETLRFNERWKIDWKNGGVEAVISEDDDPLGLVGSVAGGNIRAGAAGLPEVTLVSPSPLGVVTYFMQERVAIDVSINPVTGRLSGTALITIRNTWSVDGSAVECSTKYSYESQPR